MEEDQTENIVKSLQKQDLRIRLITLDENKVGVLQEIKVLKMQKETGSAFRFR